MWSSSSQRHCLWRIGEISEGVDRDLYTLWFVQRDDQNLSNAYVHYHSFFFQTLRPLGPTKDRFPEGSRDFEVPLIA